MQVVIDTNIIVSALLNSKGACYIFLDRVFAGVYDVIDFIIEWFWKNSLIVEVNEVDYRPDEVIDEKDIPFYITAKATKSRLVTGNIKHYPIEEMRTMIWELN